LETDLKPKIGSNGPKIKKISAYIHLSCFFSAAALDSVDIGYRRLREEGRNVGGAYAEAAATSSTRQTSRGAAAGGDAGGRGDRIGERPWTTIFEGHGGR
jgi:hypothetical protein